MATGDHSFNEGPNNLPTASAQTLHNVVAKNITIRGHAAALLVPLNQPVTPSHNLSAPFTLRQALLQCTMNHAADVTV